MCSVIASRLHASVPCFLPGVPQQEWRGELQQSGQPGEGLRGQIQARPQKMIGPPADPSQLLKVQFPLAGMRLPDGETQSSFDISTFYRMKMFGFFFLFSIEFHILLEKTEKEIPNQKL